jgi:hypothetical protein
LPVVQLEPRPQAVVMNEDLAQDVPNHGRVHLSGDLDHYGLVVMVLAGQLPVEEPSLDGYQGDFAHQGCLIGGHPARRHHLG